MKLLLISLVLVGLTACQAPLNETELSGETQGTTYHIKMVQDEKPVDLALIGKLVDEVFKNIDEKLSNYREDSEISRLNQVESTDWQQASAEIVELTDIARQVYDKSQGCYDLTVKPIFDLWGFSKHENRVPTADEVQAVLQHVGMDKLEIDKANSRLRKLDPKIKIDLSSIAQGYTVATVARLLESQGIQNYLVEIGGEMKVKGHNASGKAWRVAIEKPTAFTREIERVLEIHQEHGTAIMTAGTYRNFFESGGKTYSHILNPKTGSPVTHHLLSVTVLHDDPTWADAWDTALLCVGEEEAARIAEAENLKVLLIYPEGDKLKEQMSKAFVTAQE